MNKFLFSTYCLLILSGLFNVVSSQNIELIKSDHETFIWGEGSGTTVKMADQAALAEIISQISTQVESKTEAATTDANGEFKKHWSDVVKTYSSATLTNTIKIMIQDQPEDYKILRYVKRSEVSKIFESRKNKIIDLAKNGVEAIKNLQIADALRYFYWSQTLLRSHPEASNIKMNSGSEIDLLLITWIPKQINLIFSKLAIKIDQVEAKDSYTNYLLDIQYDKQAVVNFDFTYWDGQDWSNINSAKDGLGVVELSKSQSTGDIRLKCEYVFDGEAAMDMDLRDVMQKLPEVPYKSSYFNLTTNGTQVASTTDKKDSKQSTSTVGTETSLTPPVTNTSTSLTPAVTNMNAVNGASDVNPITEVADKESIMKKVISAISSKNYADAQALFTTEGYTIFQGLLQYGNAKILKAVELKYYQFGESVICRSIPMSFSFKSNNRTFVEDVVFYFDKTNKIDNLTFGLSKKAVDDIAANNSWSQEVRMQLINFMENYKTAYALKRLDYIEKIFSDDALIITGRVTKVNTSPEFKYLNNSIVKYNQQSKSQYLKNLKYSFGSTEFINLRFADNTVKQSGKSKSVYGIQIKQDYFSPNYGDTGYLFLLIDFTDSIAPQIHVRTWQPNKNADGSIYGLSDF